MKQWAQDQAQSMQSQIKNYENQIAQLTDAIKTNSAEINRLTALANQAHGAFLAFSEMANRCEPAESASDNTESAS